MSGPDGARDLLAALVKGGEKSVRSFLQLSGLRRLDYAPEYFLTVRMANALRKFERTYVQLEWGVADVYERARTNHQGRPPKMRNGRFDLILEWKKTERPRAVIEVKSPVKASSYALFQPDIHRLCKTVSLAAGSKGSIQFGAFAYYASANLPKKRYPTAEERLSALQCRLLALAAKVIASDPKLRRAGLNVIDKSGLPQHTEWGAWRIGCLVFVAGRNSRIPFI